MLSVFYNWRYWRASSLPVDADLLRELDTSRDDSPESESPSPAAGQESSGSCSSSAGWERWQQGGQEPASGESRASLSVTGEYPEPTDASPAGGQGFTEHGQDTAGAAEVLSDEGWGEEEGEPAPGRVRSAGVRPSPTEPAVGITFVGSFY